MMSIDHVLGQFADAWKRGERPDVDEYLAKVSSADRPALERAIDSWLDIAPAPDYDEVTLAEIRKEPTLVAALEAAAATEYPWSTRVALARRRAGLRLGDLAARVSETFGFSADQTSRTEDYLRRLEDDQLDERRVSRRLKDALATALGAAGEGLAAPQVPIVPRPAAAPSGLFRSDPGTPSDESIMDDLEILSRAAATPAPEPMDEVDRLFRGGPDA